MKTHSVKPSEIDKKWVVVDAASQPVGRLASEISRVLRGKNKPSFVPYLDCGDNVIVVNAEKVKLTGKKLTDKFYYHHSGYIGGIKARTAQEVLDAHPERILMSAVKGMLPHNKLGRKLLGNLRVYAGETHPHTAQNPEPMKPRTVVTGG